MIREANLSDVEELTKLMSELGYPTDAETMKQRYEAIDRHPDYHTLVFEHNGTLLGMVGMLKAMRFEHDAPYVRIITMVVDSSERGHGIGKKLLNAAEEWAKSQGCQMINLNSGNRPERQKAHHFYERNGFKGSATGFYKKI
ncbi:GNAT family N-acetyltransferase [Aquisalibacillus elongatus]|uniref:N-acetylglutamate synthase-like GNAT family acetyltransferase n=1 Tax=Aquisalibacillus elongatus TaxID=485577 RepID=A0A3N5C1H5_9BACI|nr:GNAT family N-acetyltransferase [Aquisalibacillus elongatus]RPF53232.1 N-acetylglutamate synthase-like GNAT family acetyltransferase [Aquisalibacillus elongatus]